MDRNVNLPRGADEVRGEDRIRRVPHQKWDPHTQRFALKLCSGTNTALQDLRFVQKSFRWTGANLPWGADEVRGEDRIRRVPNQKWDPHTQCFVLKVFRGTNTTL